MLNEHAYSRAVRAHLLVRYAFMQSLLKIFEYTPEELAIIEELTKNVDDKTLTSKQLFECNELQSIKCKFDNLLRKTATNGKTATLWIRYIRMINIFKNFIRAERIGDWDLHLSSVRNMLSYFHATGYYMPKVLTFIYKTCLL